MTSKIIQNSTLLQVNELKTYFFTAEGVVKSVDGVSFALRKGEILGLVGESGAGKSVLGFSILGLIDPPGQIVGGQILFNGKDLYQMNDKEMQKIRGRSISMIFQDPLTCLDPVFSIGYQMAETLRAHEPKLSNHDVERRSIQLLEQVGISSAKERLNSFPHHFSGGMRQRVGIAMGISSNPDLIVADEPTTALDVTTQAQIMTLLHRLVRQQGMSMILITHDIALVSQVSDTIGVMYAGHLVELGPKNSVINRPLHPYTRGLIRSIPGQTGRQKQIFQIPGMMPDLSKLPRGCPFSPRCDLKQAICKDMPQLVQYGQDHWAACHLGENQ